eukprot:365849-Chlamydomonas_euryale.AAC.2
MGRPTGSWAYGHSTGQRASQSTNSSDGQSTGQRADRACSQTTGQGACWNDRQSAGQTAERAGSHSAHSMVRDRPRL